LSPTRSNRTQTFAQTWTLLPYGTSPPDHVEFAYGNDTVYFPQPSLSQFGPGGSGLGVFDANRTASLKDGESDTKLALLRNRNTPKDGVGVGLRYVYITILLQFSLQTDLSDTHNGESGFIARNFLTPELTCEANLRRCLKSRFSNFVVPFVGYPYRIKRSPMPSFLKIFFGTCLLAMEWIHLQWS